MNHIPLRPTYIVEVVAIALDAFDQLVILLDLHSAQFPVLEARSHFHDMCLSTLKNASEINKFGFKNTGRFLFDSPAVIDGLGWLMKHLFCSGLDKASGNACFMCIKHIRL